MGEIPAPAVAPMFSRLNNPKRRPRTLHRRKYTPSRFFTPEIQIARWSLNGNVEGNQENSGSISLQILPLASRREISKKETLM